MRALLRVVGGAIVGSICLQLCFEGVVGPLLPPSPQLVAMVVACGLALFERLWVGGRGQGGGVVGGRGEGGGLASSVGAPACTSPSASGYDLPSPHGQVP